MQIKWLYAMMLSLLALSCSEDDPSSSKTVASFQFAADADDFFTVHFTNFSTNATSYSWDFGDGSAASTEEDPTHTYTAGGTYSVTLTATGGNVSTKTQNVIVVDPDAALTLLTGSVSKTWKLLREGPAMGIGPDAANWTLWFNNSNNGTRNCLYDDEFIFHRDGTFEYADNGTFWGEGDVYYNTDKADLAESCFDATVANLTVDGNDYSSWLSGSHAFDYNIAQSTITLTGEGVWMGLLKLGSDGYVTTPQSVLQFDVNIADGGDTGVDTLEVIYNYASLPNYWKFVYVSYEDPADEPALSGPLPKPNFTYTVDNGTKTATFTNTSLDADSYSWDFGDGATSDCSKSFTHLYNQRSIYCCVNCHQCNCFS